MAPDQPAAPAQLEGEQISQPQQQTNQPPPTVNTSIMAKHPAINGQWQVARVVANPNDSNVPLVQFQDGTQYLWHMLSISSSPVAPPTQAAMSAAGPVMGSLRQDYADFLRDTVQLFARAQALFQLPLQSIITMAYRQAYRAQLEGSGRMDVVSNEAMFIPDLPTFERWVRSYLEEVQRREQSGGSPE